MLLLAADESLHGHIIRGLRHRDPTIELVTADEAGLGGSADPVVLDWAAAAGRVVITQDERTMVGFAWDRVRQGLPMPGLIVRPKRVSVRQTIDDLLFIAQCGEPGDFQNQVWYLPLQ